MIDEKKLIEILSRNSIFEKITNAEGKNIYEIIDELPKTGDWIPCSERLPDIELRETLRKRGTNAVLPLLVTVLNISPANGRKLYVGKAFYFEYMGRKTFYDNDLDEVERVIAWQPLPEPYKEGVGYVRCEMDKN